MERPRGEARWMDDKDLRPVSIDPQHRSANSLDIDECRSIMDAVQVIQPQYAAHVYTDPLGEASVMLMPPDLDDAIGPMLVAHRVGPLFILDQFRWDAYANVGEYATLEKLIDALCTALCQQYVAPRQDTIH
jgi:hypothetical protein